MFALAYLLAFATVGIAVSLRQGGNSWKDWAAVAGAGLLLSLASGGVGTALGVSTSRGKGRVRAFGAALITWFVLVFALDAVLLASLVAFAPAPPTGVGEHGHAELAAPSTLTSTRPAPRSEDPHARHSEPQGPPAATLSTWVMALNPISLFRVTALATSPVLRPRLGMALPTVTPGELGTVVAFGWLLWLALPLGVAFFRFQRTDLH